MAKRVCAEPGCPTVGDTTRCEQHTRERDRARGTRQERGYGPAHRRLRAEWQSKLDDGETIWCWRCLAAGTHTRIDPKCWDLGHNDNDRSRHEGPECRACNRATSGRRD